jgi:hypothetical protein
VLIMDRVALSWNPNSEQTGYLLSFRFFISLLLTLIAHQHEQPNAPSTPK